MILVSITVCTVFLLFSCDMEKYLSANLDTESQVDSTMIFGQVKLQDNNQIVACAMVKIGYYSSRTDEYGRYELLMPISNDDTRNLATPVLISSPKFLSYVGVTYLIPAENRLDIDLVYAAPIFQAVGIRKMSQTLGKLTSFHASVKDLQGVDDIKEVTAIAFDEHYNKDVIIVLKKNYDIDRLTSFWESEPYLGSLRVIPNKGISVSFIAVDRSGHKEETTKILSD